MKNNAIFLSYSFGEVTGDFINIGDSESVWDFDMNGTKVFVRPKIV